MIVVAVLAALVAEFWWILVPVTIVTVTFVLVRRGVRVEQRAAVIRKWLAAELAWRADQQDEWMLDGDLRGLYGIYPPADLADPRRFGHRGPPPVSPESRRRREVDRAQSRGILAESIRNSPEVRVVVTREANRLARRLNTITDISVRLID